MWDANVNKALEDLQEEQRRAAGGDPCPHRAAHAQEHSKAALVSQQVWPQHELLPKHVGLLKPQLSNIYFSNK